MFTIAIVAGAPRRSPTGLCNKHISCTQMRYAPRAQRNKSENTVYPTTEQAISCSPLRLQKAHFLYIGAIRHAHKETIARIPTPDCLTNPVWYQTAPTTHTKARRLAAAAWILVWAALGGVRGGFARRGSSPCGAPLGGFFASFLSHERNEDKREKNYRLPQSIFRLAAMLKRGAPNACRCVQQTLSPTSRSLLHDLPKGEPLGAFALRRCANEVRRRSLLSHTAACA